MTKGIKDLSKTISEIIIHGIQEKKGSDIVSLDLRELKCSISDFFIICHAESSTQVRAIAESVEAEMNKSLSEEAFRKEGFENAEWILLDYINVVVHIFRHEKRPFYGIEELWGDAIIHRYKSA
jgi:ribosome-associated protein